MFQPVTRFDDCYLELGMRLNSQIRLFAGLLCVIGLVVFGSLRLWIGKSLTPKGESRFAYVDRPTAEDHAQWDREAAEFQRVKLGGDDYLPLQRLFEFPGVDHPSMVSKDHIALASETPIVGIEVSGEAYAFVLDSMSDPRTHIVNLYVHGVAISVTYCNLVDCIRVLTTEGKELLPLGVGGLDVDNQLVLLWQGIRYGQSSTKLPLADYPFHRMEWGEWLSKHPDTRVYRAADPSNAG